MTFEFDPTFAEQCRATLAVMVRSRVHLVGAVSFAAVGVVVLLASGLAQSLHVTSIALLGVLMLALSCVFWFPVVTLFHVASLRRSLRIGGHYAWVIDDDGIHISAPVANVSVRWAAITRTGETKRFFLFFFSRRWAHFLPKRVVPAEQLDALRQFVASHRSKP